MVKRRQPWHNFRTSALHHERAETGLDSRSLVFFLKLDFLGPSRDAATGEPPSTADTASGETFSLPHPPAPRFRSRLTAPVGCFIPARDLPLAFGSPSRGNHRAAPIRPTIPFSATEMYLPAWGPRRVTDRRRPPSKAPTASHSSSATKGQADDWGRRKVEVENRKLALVLSTLRILRKNHSE